MLKNKNCWFFFALICFFNFLQAEEKSPIFEFDAIKRITSINYQDSTKIKYAYDLSNNRTSMIDSLGETKYLYDLFDRLIKVEYPNKKTLEYQYDAFDNLVKIIYPDNSEVNYTYDKDNRVIQVGDFTGLTTFEYDQKRNLLIKQTLPNKVTTEYFYDKNYRITKVIHKSEDGSLVASFEYEFDLNGNRTRITEKTNTSNLTADYSYDNLNRLIEAKYSDGFFEKFTYDGIGNRLSLETPKEKINYEYDENQKLIKANNTEFFYDEKGNLIKKISDKNTCEYFFDNANHLIKYKDNKTLVFFEYDGDGNRISKTVNGKKLTYINDLINYSHVIEQIDENSQKTTNFTYAISRISKTCEKSSHFYLYDTLGKNVSFTLDNKGKIEDFFHYFAFGQNKASSKNDIGFCGEEFDEETGLIYLRNRYYDPEIGRFISQDIIQGSIYNPQSLNRYTYVHNNPINWVDPTGLKELPPEGYEILSVYAHKIWIPKINCFEHGWVEFTQHDGTIKVQSINPGTGESPKDKRTVDGKIPYHHTPNAVHLDFLITEKQAERARETGKIQAQKRYWLINRDCCDHVLAVTKAANIDLPDLTTLSISDPTKLVAYIKKTNAEKLVAKGAELREAIDSRCLSNYLLIQGKQLGTKLVNDSNDLIVKPVSHFISNSLEKIHKRSLQPDIRKELDFVNQNEVDLIMPTITPNYGGVSLCKAANLLLNLEDIQGAIFDQNTGELILFGKTNYTLPKMDLDDLAVAIRSVYGINCDPQDPGVSIDHKNPNDTTQVVSYYGATINTSFGKTMFEADLLLKKLALGQDFNNQQFNSTVTGYKNVPDMYSTARPNNINYHLRFWFVPEEISLNKSESGNEMVFNNVKMKVLSESAFFGQKSDNDPFGKAFIDHFNNHYDEFAKEFQELEKLKNLGKITAIVKWLYNNHIPIDLSFFESYNPKYLQTPAIIPLITRSHSENFLTGGKKDKKGRYKESPIVNTWTYTCSGGVNFTLNPNNFIEYNDPKVNLLNQTITEARPNELTQKWDFISPLTKEKLVAVAHPIHKTLRTGNVKKIFVDLSCSLPGNNRLTLTRCYNSFNDSISGFGKGWEIVPAKLIFPNQKVKFTLEKPLSKTYLLYYEILLKLLNTEKKFRIKNFIDMGVLYECIDAPSLHVVQKNDGSFLFVDHNKIALSFDKNGNLTNEYLNDKLTIVYHYNEKKQLIKIAWNDKQIHLEYQDDRIIKAEGPVGIIDYIYNETGQLAVVTKGPKKNTYFYDESQRLIKIINEQNEIVFDSSYDDSNRAVCLQNDSPVTKEFDITKHEEKTSWKGLDIFSQYDDKFRLLSAKNSLNEEIQFKYDNEFGPSEIIDSDGAKFEYKYDQYGNIVSIKNPIGAENLFVYDDFGNLIYFENPNGRGVFNIYKENKLVNSYPNCKATISHFALHQLGGLMTNYIYNEMGNLKTIANGCQNTSFEYDPDGKLITIIFPSGFTLHRKYDEKERIVKIFDDGDYFIEYEYDDLDRIIKISKPIGEIKYSYDSHNNLSSITDPKGLKSLFSYDENSSLNVLTDANGTLFGF